MSSLSTARRSDVALVAILALALAFRLYRIDVPLVDGHSWRQVTNADIARHFATTTWNPFTPEVSWGGRDGVVGMEFPLLQYLIGVGWRFFGESERLARLVSVAFSTASVWLIYLVGRDLFSVSVGRAAALVLAISPSSIFFGRSVLSDTPMITFMIAAVLAWHRNLDRPSRGRFLAAVACTALAGLVKLPGVIVGVPIAMLAWSHRGWGVLRDRTVWLGGVISVASIAAWYWYADRVAVATGLTQAIFRPSGVYGPEIGLAPDAYKTVSHWSTLGILENADFFREMLDRFWDLHLTPLGFAGALIGWWMARGEKYAGVLDAWIGAGIVLLFASAEGQYWHQFHQLPLIPPLALFAAFAIAPIFQIALPRFSVVRATGIAVSVVALALIMFHASSVLPHLYRDDNLQVQFPAVGSEVRSVTQDDALLVTVDYEEGGTNSPMLLYYAHRQGWSFDVHAVDQNVVERLRRDFGARYFVTFKWTAIGREKPELVYYLANFESIRLRNGDSQVRMFDLGKPIRPTN